jgi:deoxyadenosine/deoxycytidine kinase
MKYICVEGCIGVGKTTVATQLAKAINDAFVLFEDFDSHPFLSDFYDDSRYTFETEINFLLIHYHQLLKTTHKQPKFLISDYFFDKDKLFADANILSDKEMAIFMELYTHLRSRLPLPDVVICLYGSTDLIYNRILNRNRESEKNISYEYIEKINNHYSSFFAELKTDCFTIDVNMNDNDFVKDPSLILALKQKIL